MFSKSQIRAFIKKHPLIMEWGEAFYDEIVDRTSINNVFNFFNPIKEKKLGRLNKDKRFCVISSITPSLGITSIWVIMALKARIALDAGYIPIFDMKRHKPPAATGIMKDPSINYWDLFFKQYTESFSIEEVYSSAHVGFFTKWLRTNNGVNRGSWFFSTFIDEDVRQAFHQLSGIIGPREDVFSDEMNHIFQSKTLGVMIRRSMEQGALNKHLLYTTVKGHHKKGSIYSYINWIEENLYKLGFNQFLLCTDDRETQEVLSHHFGDACVSFDRPLWHRFNKGKAIPFNSKEFTIEFPNVEEMSYRAPLDYLKETIWLSKCDGILKTAVGQQRMALVLAKDRIPLIETNLFLDMRLS